MKKILFILSTFVFANIAYGQDGGYKKGTENIDYKIIRNGNKNPLQEGEYIEIYFTNFLNHNGKDSLIRSTRAEGSSQIIPFDAKSFPPSYFSIFKEMNAGDSLSTKILVDSMFKQSPENMPPFMALGDLLFTNVSIVNVYKTKAEADLVTKKNQEKAAEAAKAKGKLQAVEDDLAISNYIIANNVKATKLPSAVYVSIEKEGVGTVLSKKQFVKIKYRGKTLKGLVFDTNMDASKGHEEPLTVNLTDDKSLGNGVIQGMTNALLAMKVGTIGSMYIPSGLAYGPTSRGGEIGANENMIFDVEILSAQTVEQFKAEQNKLSKPATGSVVESAKDAAKKVVEAAKAAVTNSKTPKKKAPLKSIKKVLKKK